MNILFLSPWHPYPPDNGSKLRAYHLIKALAQHHQVTLVSFAFDTARPEAPCDLHARCRDVRTVKLDPFAANRAGALRTFLSLRPVVSRPVPAMQELVAAVLGGRVFDAVIASTEMMADYALQAPASAVRILEEHNAMARWMEERYRRARHPLHRLRCWASWQKCRWYEARFYPRFDLITMVSEPDRRATLAAIGAGGPPVAVVPNGVDCRDRRPGLAEPLPDRLVYNGSLTYYANYNAVRFFLEEIFPRVRQARPQAHLVVTGSLAGVDTAGLPLSDGVTLTGFVEDVRLPVAQATACVVPLLDGGGTRLKVLEAMALGTPVVATSKGAEGLDVADGEHLLLADDPQTFAARTVELLSNPDLRRRLAANARCLVEQRYDWDAIGRRFVALVEETVARHRALLPSGD